MRSYLAVLAAALALTTLALATTASSGVVVSPVYYLQGHTPRAGHLFMGLDIVDTNTAPDQFTANCGSASIGRKQLRLAQNTLPRDGQTPSAVTCVWRIPTHTRGKQLTVTGAHASAGGAGGYAGNFTWRIR